MFKHSLPSIEMFAAYLDGNLSQNEMQQFVSLANHDDALHQLLDASNILDDTMSHFTDTDLQLPPELIDPNFSLPTIPDIGISPFVALSPEPMDDMLVAATDCAANDISMFSDVHLDHQLSPEDILNEDSLHSLSDGDGFEVHSELTDAFPDDI